MNNRRNLHSNSPRTIASFPSYQEAESAINYLSDNDFPIQYASIVADDLQFVEKITGKVTRMKRLGNSILLGIFIGATIGFFFGLFDIMRPNTSTVTVAIYGSGFGALFGLLFGLPNLFSPEKSREFNSEASFRANFFDVIVDDQYTQQATHLLNKSGQWGDKTDEESTEPRKLRIQPDHRQAIVGYS
jgi:uncharacterized membrane protein